MMFNFRRQRVQEFQYPRVFVEIRDGMPVYSFKTPMAGRGSTLVQILFAVGGMAVFGWAMENTQGWLNENWRGGLVLGSFALASYAGMKAMTPKRARIRIDSRDLTLKFDFKRHDLTAFEAFTVEPHPYSKNPNRRHYRNWLCVFGLHGPMGGHKMALAEVKNGDEQGEAGLIRAAFDWCGRRAWEAHQQAKRPAVATAPPKNRKTASQDEGESWPLDG